MKIVPQAAPSQPQAPAGAKTSTPDQVRARAIEKFMTAGQPAAPQAQEMPVVNPTQVSPEEASAAGFPKLGQQVTNEEPSESPASPAEPRVADDKLSSQYAALARKEKALRLRDQQLKAREAALVAQAAPKAPETPSFDPSKYISRDKIMENPFSVLTDELGLTYDQLTDLAINAPKPEQIELNRQIRALQDEIKALRGETEATKKTFQEQQDQQNTQALTLMKNEAKKLIKADASYELVRSTPGAIDEAVKLIEKTYYEDGELLTVEEAIQAVEDHLVEEAIKFAKLSKIQRKLQPAQSAVQDQKNTTAQPQQQSQLKTLTNSVGTSRQLNAKERAILAFQGKLNK